MSSGSDIEVEVRKSAKFGNRESNQNGLVQVPMKRTRPQTPESGVGSLRDVRTRINLRSAMGLHTPPASSPGPAQDQYSAEEPFLHSLIPEPGEIKPKLRDVCLSNIQARYPELNTANLRDFDILVLASAPDYHGTTADVAEWLTQQLHFASGGENGVVRIMEDASKILDEPADVTGVSMHQHKPSPNDPQALIRQVNDSEYSLRLWPGSAAAREWCLDFVHSQTMQPKNRPFPFELYLVPTAGTSIPWLPAGLKRVLSLERNFGMKAQDVPIQFTVPSRPQSAPEHVQIVDF